MSKKEPELVTTEQLPEKLRIILESWPLYREFHYYGTPYSFVPSRIELYCDKPECQKPQLWSTDIGTYGQKGGFVEQQYTCNNCRKNITRFYIAWYGAQDASKEGMFLKAGQYPALSHRPPNELKKRFSDEDFSLYTKALTCRNHSFGLAAVSYLRRIVENRMNDLLDLLQEVATVEKTFSEELAQIDKLKAPGTRFDDKISFAARLVPAELLRMTEGQNPIDRLHDLASEAIHYKPEDECIEIFDRCRTIFEYVFKQLQVTAEDGKAFLATMQSTRKAKAEQKQKTPA